MSYCENHHDLTPYLSQNGAPSPIKQGVEFRKKENIAAITAEIYACSRGRAWAGRYADDHQGICAVYDFLITAAAALDRVEPLFGDPGEDYDWMLAVETYAELIVNTKTPYGHSDSELIQLAKKACFQHRYNHVPNPNLTERENAGLF
jgi:hypothetical protein